MCVCDEGGKEVLKKGIEMKGKGRGKMLYCVFCFCLVNVRELKKG